jgi:hypothetical protein
MCGTAILLIGPALARMLITDFGFTFDNSVTTSKLVMVAIPGVIAIVDSIRKKRISPFTVVLGVMIVNALLWVLRNTAFWQIIGGAIAKII